MAVCFHRPDLEIGDHVPSVGDDVNGMMWMQGSDVNKETLESQLWLHIHRGIGYLMGNKNNGIEDLLK